MFHEQHRDACRDLSSRIVRRSNSRDRRGYSGCDH
jgi:hypothetical protein